MLMHKEDITLFFHFNTTDAFLTLRCRETEVFLLPVYESIPGVLNSDTAAMELGVRSAQPPGGIFRALMKNARI
jgi:hypothetical protein